MSVVVLGGLVAALLLPLILATVRQRSLLPMAARNLSRRRGEAVLIIAGSMLGTAIITSSFVVGDIIDGSIADAARTRLGPVDIVATPADPSDLDAVAAAIESAQLAEVDGTLQLTTTVAAIEGLGSVRASRAIPSTTVTELDVRAARDLGSDPGITGLDGLTPPQAGEVVLNQRSADRLDAATGEELRVHAYGTSTDLTVSAIVPELGLAGYGGAIVAPGTLQALAADASVPAAPPRASVAVSLAGGVFDTREANDSAALALRTAMADIPGTEITSEKADLLDAAEREGAAVTELFTTIGAFSVLAGILLLVNLFVMLAEERKSELGMLRALGFSRRRLTRVFALEGALYAVTAAAIGTLIGIGIGWVVALAAGRIFGIGEQGLAFRLVIEPTSLAIGGLTGLGIALSTIWLTSLRIGRLNIIRAIRDLPEPSVSHIRLRKLVLGAVGVIVGAALTLAGMVGEAAIPLMLGVPVAAFAAVPLLRRLLPERPVRVAVAVIVLVWGIVVFDVFSGIMAAADISVFVAQGVVLTTGAVSLASTLDKVWRFAVDRLAARGRGLATRLGLAYPLARRFRTSMLLGMFSLVIFTMTFIAALSSAFDQQIPTFTDDVRGGFDVVIDSNAANPVGMVALAARDEVAAVAPLTRSLASFEIDSADEPLGELITGFDAALLDDRPPALTDLAEGYPDDRAVYEAVLADPGLAIVPDYFLSDTSGEDHQVRAGETFWVMDPGTDEPRQLTAAAVIASDWVFNGVLVSRTLTTELFGDGDIPSRHYVAVADGVDADRYAEELAVALLAHGAEVETFGAIVELGLQQQASFFGLLQGFLGLGLLIGIAGLGVVMIRAVRERRQDIGVLRAMGFSVGLVRSAFLTEAGLIATQGTVIGAALGLATARQVLTSWDGFGEAALAFVVPWTALAIITLMPMVAGLLAAAWPAARAAAIRPAIALRVAD